MTDEVVIGVTGHRPNRLKLSDGLLRDAVNAALDGIALETRQVRPAARLVALSALAEGADQIFASAALDGGYALRVILPMAPEDYSLTFSNPGNHSEFDRLLTAAESVVVLDGSPKQASAAFQALGIELVRRCDLMIGVWDGKAAAGPGGTAAVMQRALLQHGVIGWIDATTSRPVSWMKALLPEPVADENFSLTERMQ